MKEFKELLPVTPNDDNSKETVCTSFVRKRTNFQFDILSKKENFSLNIEELSYHSIPFWAPKLCRWFLVRGMKLGIGENAHSLFDKKL